MNGRAELPMASREPRWIRYSKLTILCGLAFALNPAVCFSACLLNESGWLPSWVVLLALGGYPVFLPYGIHGDHVVTGIVLGTILNTAVYVLLLLLVARVYRRARSAANQG